MIDLLQIAYTLTKATQFASGDSNHDGSLSFFELLKMGGWIMIPLGVMLLLAYLVGFDQGAVSRSGMYLHELMHDGRHLLGVPCH